MAQASPEVARARAPRPPSLIRNIATDLLFGGILITIGCVAFVTMSLIVGEVLR